MRNTMKRLMVAGAAVLSLGAGGVATAVNSYAIDEPEAPDGPGEGRIAVERCYGPRTFHPTIPWENTPVSIEVGWCANFYDGEPGREKGDMRITEFSCNQPGNFGPCDKSGTLNHSGISLNGYRAIFVSAEWSNSQADDPRIYVKLGAHGDIEEL